MPAKINKPAKVTKPTTRKAKFAEVTNADAFALFTGAFNASKAEGDFTKQIAAAYKKHGSNDTLRTYAICGRLAYTQNLAKGGDPTEATAVAARAILEKPGAGSKETNRRTEAEEKAYAAARAWLKRILGAAGVTTHETRGGARPQSGKGKKADAPKPGDQTIVTPINATPNGKPADTTPSIVPDIKNKPIDPAADDAEAVPEVIQEVRRHAKACLDLVNANAKRKGSAAIVALVTRFYAEVSKLILEDELTV